MTYYFFSYSCISKDRPTLVLFGNGVTSQHPFERIEDLKLTDMGWVYNLLSFHEITVSEYELCVKIHTK